MNVRKENRVYYNVVISESVTCSRQFTSCIDDFTSSEPREEAHHNKHIHDEHVLTSNVFVMYVLIMMRSSRGSELVKSSIQLVNWREHVTLSLIS